MEMVVDDHLVEKVVEEMVEGMVEGMVEEMEELLIDSVWYYTFGSRRGKSSNIQQFYHFLPFNFIVRISKPIFERSRLRSAWNENPNGFRNCIFICPERTTLNQLSVGASSHHYT